MQTFPALHEDAKHLHAKMRFSHLLLLSRLQESAKAASLYRASSSMSGDKAREHLPRRPTQAAQTSNFHLVESADRAELQEEDPAQDAVALLQAEVLCQVGRALHAHC